MPLTTLLAIMKHMSRPKSAAINNIDIADILGQKYRYQPWRYQPTSNTCYTDQLPRQPVSQSLTHTCTYSYHSHLCI